MGIEKQQVERAGTAGGRRPSEPTSPLKYALAAAPADTARRILLSALKAWLTGYATAAVPSIVGIILKCFRKGFNKFDLRDTVVKIVRVLLEKSPRARMPWFFLALIGGFKALDRVADMLVRYMYARNAVKSGKEVTIDDDKHDLENGGLVKDVTSAKTTTVPPAIKIINPSFIAAAISSGLSLLIIPKAKRADFAIVTLVRALDSFASFQKTWITDGLKKRKVPLSLVGNADSAIFILACARIMFCWFYTQEALPRDYTKWISKMSRLDVRPLEAVRLLSRGEMVYGRDTGHANLLGDYAVSLGLPFASGDPANGQIPCTVVHGGIEGCIRHLYHVWWFGFWDALRIYIPVHLLPALIFHRHRFTHPTKAAETIWRIALGAVRSATFLATFIDFVWLPICAVRNITNDDSYLGPTLGAMLSGTSIFIERKSRRREMMLYVVPKAIESVWWSLTKYGPGWKVPGAEVPLFGLGMGYLLSAYGHHPKALRPAVRGVLGFFLV
ncbi:uncharacterized protein EV422DRAFT_528084 [Fimicolochytrium jonesii]|uniref:uncharacterized protein n=1 Tax=Fimicolochytrium jonesii TaxID=1396493 RepID=UPI0022FF1E4C|nr:uncharacterized protein EV422DRAFT_528084 [Fimicolochytrium jonesii]KAI8821419.1 hypothetical protein EV422DRAFT_528084 [Fimicolochytrium jonesii]